MSPFGAEWGFLGECAGEEGEGLLVDFGLSLTAIEIALPLRAAQFFGRCSVL